MENIEVYLKAAEAYGVPVTGRFAVVDLYENRNLGAVISSLQLLGTEVSEIQSGQLQCSFFVLVIILCPSSNHQCMLEHYLLPGWLS